MIAKILISPSVARIKEEVNSILVLHIGSVTVNHPDVLHFPADAKLGVEEVKEIKNFLSIKPYQTKGRLVVLEDASNLTIEAQNALLKTLEEPPEEAILLLGADSEANFLPTILSRCQIVTLTSNVIARNPAKPETKQSFTEDIQKLLNQDLAERFEYIEKLKDQKEREEFLHALVAYFHRTLNVHPKGVHIDFLKELLQGEEWVEANVNIRGILEYLMLKMPSRT